MDVPGEGIAAALRLARLVVQDEGAEAFARLEAAHAPRLGRIARLAVVVAAHERKGESLARFAPRGEAPQRPLGASLGAVQEVAEKDHLARARAVDGAPEPLDVLARRALRKRNACAPEARRLAEVEVGDEERAFRGPVHRLLGEEHEPFARDDAL